MPTAAAIAAAAGGNLSPTAPGLSGAAAGGNLSPDDPAQLVIDLIGHAAVVTGNLTDGTNPVVIPRLHYAGIMTNPGTSVGTVRMWTSDGTQWWNTLPSNTGVYYRLIVAHFNTGDYMSLQRVSFGSTSTVWTVTIGPGDNDPTAEDWNGSAVAPATGDPSIAIFGAEPTIAAIATAAGGNLAPTAPGAITA